MGQTCTFNIGRWNEDTSLLPAQAGKNLWGLEGVSTVGCVVGFDVKTILV